MTRIWTGTADVVSGYTTVVLTGDPLTAANCPADATIVLAGSTYFVADADYPTMTVELTRAYEAGDGTVSAEIDPMTPLTGSVVALAKSIADYDAQLALLEARGLGMFYSTIGQTGAEDPEPGNIARDAAAWSDVTALYVDVLDATEASIDQSSRLDNLATGDSLVIESLSSGAFSFYTLSGAVAAATGWRTLPVAYLGGGGMIADEEFVRIVGLKRGPAGADGTDGADGADGVGIPSGGATGYALVKLSGTDYDTAWAARREVLTANRTYYVRTDGSDSNTGLANTAGGAFLTPQKAWNVALTLDLSGFSITVEIAAGTYSSGVAATTPLVGGTLTFNGVGATTIVQTTTANCFSASGGAKFTLTNMKLDSTSGSLLFASDGGSIFPGTGLTFGSTTASHMRANSGGTIQAVYGAAWTTDGGAGFRLWALGGFIGVDGVTETLSGTPAVTTWAEADFLGRISAFGYTFSGAATGARYGATQNSMINTFGAGASYFPGNAAGSTATGGQYA